MITDPLFYALAIPAILITDMMDYRWANILLFATGWKLIRYGVSMLKTQGLLYG